MSNVVVRGAGIAFFAAVLLIVPIPTPRENRVKSEGEHPDHAEVTPTGAMFVQT